MESYYSSELIHLNSTETYIKKKKTTLECKYKAKESMQKVNRKPTWRRRNYSGVRRVMVARSASVLLLMFCVWVCLLPPSLLCASITFSTDSELSFPISAVFICRKINGAKASFLFFFCCLSPVLYSLLSFLIFLLSFPCLLGH
jgi:hypothetical protein